MNSATKQIYVVSSTNSRQFGSSPSHEGETVAFSNHEDALAYQKYVTRIHDDDDDDDDNNNIDFTISKVLLDPYTKFQLQEEGHRKKVSALLEKAKYDVILKLIKENKYALAVSFFHDNPNIFSFIPGASLQQMKRDGDENYYQARTDHIKRVSKAFKKRFNDSVYDELPLHIAVKYCTIDMVRLVAKYAHPNVIDSNGFSPLHIAVQTKDPEKVQLMLDLGIDQRWSAWESGSACTLAVKLGYIESLDLLYKSDPDIINYAGGYMRPIWQAKYAAPKSFSAFKWLMLHGVEPCDLRIRFPHTSDSFKLIVIMLQGGFTDEDELGNEEDLLSFAYWSIRDGCDIVTIAHFIYLLYYTGILEAKVSFSSNYPHRYPRDTHFLVEEHSDKTEFSFKDPGHPVEMILGRDQSKELVKDFNHLKLEIFRDRITEICIGLQPLSLSALETLLIVDEAIPYVRILSDHVKWNIITKIKHLKT